MPPYREYRQALKSRKAQQSTLMRKHPFMLFLLFFENLAVSLSRINNDQIIFKVSLYTFKNQVTNITKNKN